MTRLIYKHIKHIGSSCGEWDLYLKSKAGVGLADIAAKVSGMDVLDIEKAAAALNIYVVPVTSGQGRIDFFSESVAAVIKAVGFAAQVSPSCDVEGLYEARLDGADIVFMADDNRYIALNLNNGKIGENNIATARGYTEVLDSCAGGIASREVLLIGYGILGKEMALALSRKSASVTIYDKDAARLSQAGEDGYKAIDDRDLIKGYGLIADASSEGGWLTAGLLPDSFVMVAPGVPLSLGLSAQAKHRGRFFHDTLEIGTAAMLGMAL